MSTMVIDGKAVAARSGATLEIHDPSNGELVDTVRGNASIDWTIRENVRAKLRVSVKRILRKYGYPPDKQEKATRTVIEQAELICVDAA